MEFQTFLKEWKLTLLSFIIAGIVRKQLTEVILFSAVNNYILRDLTSVIFLSTVELVVFLFSFFIGKKTLVFLKNGKYSSYLKRYV